MREYYINKIFNLLNQLASAPDELLVILYFFNQQIENVQCGLWLSCYFKQIVDFEKVAYEGQVLKTRHAFLIQLKNFNEL